jgi:polar amino acid transport system substrate-binding protein
MTQMIPSRARLGAALSIIFAVFAGGVAAAQSAETLKLIKQKGVVTVGTEAAFPPFEFVENGKIVGYGKDILDHVVAGLGVKLNQLDVPYQGIMPGLLSGKFDFVATTILLTPERAKQFAFTMPIADGTGHIMKRKGDDRIKSIDDLSGKKVGTQLGTINEQDLKALEQQFKGKGRAGFQELKLFTAMPEAFLALANRQLDAVSSPLPSLTYVMSKRPGTYEIVGPVGAGKIYIGWIARPDDMELRDFLNQKIKELHENAKLTELQKKWFGITMDLPTSGYLPTGAK